MIRVVIMILVAGLMACAGNGTPNRGKRIKVTGSQIAKPVSARSKGLVDVYSRERLLQTAEMRLERALRRLSPAVRITGAQGR